MEQRLKKVDAPRGLGLGNRDVGEKESQLREEQGHVAASEDLGHESAAALEDVSGDVERCKEELGLEQSTTDETRL